MQTIQEGKASLVLFMIANNYWASDDNNRCWGQTIMPYYAKVHNALFIYIHDASASATLKSFTLLRHCVVSYNIFS